jgi:hypothetical protein
MLRGGGHAARAVESETAMPFVVVFPETLVAASADVGGIGSALSAANAVAASATTTVVAAAGDEVSAAIAALFSSHGQQYQALSAQAAALRTPRYPTEFGGEKMRLGCSRRSPTD